MNATEPPCWWVSIGSSNALVLSGNKPLPEPMLAYICVNIHITRPQLVNIECMLYYFCCTQSNVTFLNSIAPEARVFDNYRWLKKSDVCPAFTETYTSHVNCWYPVIICQKWAIISLMLAANSQFQSSSGILQNFRPCLYEVRFNCRETPSDNEWMDDSTPSSGPFY